VKFLDESGSHIAMTPLRGRAPSGQRLQEAVPRNRGTVTTLLAAIGLEGMFALMTIEGGTSGEVFTAYVTDILVPTLKPGDIVVADNLAAHKVPAARAAIEAVGASLHFQPRYSPDLNPIEHAWSKVKQAMRRMKPRSIEELDQAFATAAGQVTQGDAQGWFDHCASRPAQWS
jgi:transposase